MREAVFCRLKVGALLTLFLLPVFASWWIQKTQRDFDIPTLVHFPPPAEWAQLDYDAIESD